jgi:hypothetical protein
LTALLSGAYAWPLVRLREETRSDGSVPARVSAALIAASCLVGTVFGYRLSEAARVVFTIERRLRGRRAGKSCARPTAANRKHRVCTRLRRIGAFAQQAVAGADSKPFSGRIGHRQLAPGAYRASLVATDAAGNASQAAHASFVVVKAGR